MSGYIKTAFEPFDDNTSVKINSLLAVLPGSQAVPVAPEVEIYFKNKL